MNHIKKWNVINESKDDQIQISLSILKDSMVELSDKYEVGFIYYVYQDGYGLGADVELNHYIPNASDFYLASQILDIPMPGTKKAQDEIIDVCKLSKEGLDRYRSHLVWNKIEFSFTYKDDSVDNKSYFSLWINMKYQ